MDAASVTSHGTTSFTEAEFRSALGLLPTGVVVVTVAAPGGVRAGVTCNSFTSLSLDPPLVLFCIANDSRTWSQVRAAGTFCVNVLASNHDRVGVRFAADEGDRFIEGTWVERPGGYGLADALCWIDCTVETSYDGGDHRIVVGRVRHFQVVAYRSPLVFYQGRFTRLVETVAKVSTPSG